MRLHLSLTRNTEPVDFNYQHALSGVLHRWLGENDLHDKISLYSFSWLRGGEAKRGGLDFPTGTTFFISFHEEEFGRQLAAGILRSPAVIAGMIVDEVRIQLTPEFSGKEVFRVAAPVLIKRKNGDRIDHLLFDNPLAGECLTSTLKHKLDVAGVSANALVKFDVSHERARTKLVSIGNIKNRASLCPVIVEGSPEAVAFAWNVGVGNSTGVGFGALV